MATKEELLQQSIDAADALTANILSYTDNISKQVTTKVNDVTLAADIAAVQLNNLKNNVRDILPLTPNVIADSAYFDLWCNGEKNVWYDILKEDERAKALRVIGVNIRPGLDLQRSSLRIKVIPGIGASNIPDPDTGIMINGELARINPNYKTYGFSKHILVFDMVLYKKIDTTESVMFWTTGIGNWQAPFFGVNSAVLNPMITGSYFFNNVKADVGTITDDSYAVFSFLQNAGAQGTIPFNANKTGFRSQYTKNGSIHRGVAHPMLSEDFNKWFHVGAIADSHSGGVALENHILLGGDHWKTTPLKLTFASTLHYQALGGYSIEKKAVWAPEATKISEVVSESRYPMGIRYPINK